MRQKTFAFVNPKCIGDPQQKITKINKIGEIRKENYNSNLQRALRQWKNGMEYWNNATRIV